MCESDTKSQQTSCNTAFGLTELWQLGNSRLHPGSITGTALLSMVKKKKLMKLQHFGRHKAVQVMLSKPSESILYIGPINGPR